MQQIINFILKNRIFLLFLLLFSISITLTIQSHSYHKSKVINSANAITGYLHTARHSVVQYFNLKQQNSILIEENNRLRLILHNTISNASDPSFIDTINYNSHYKFTPATVVKNQYHTTTNMLLVNKGKADGVQVDFGVITSNGIIGIVNETSDGFATIIPILNKNSRINAQLKKTNHFGSLIWNTEDPSIVQLIDIEKIAPVTVGDTIITGGRSTSFPKGIPIGRIERFKLDAAEDFYEIDVKLFNDMTNLNTVYIIENLKLSEIKLLESNTP